MSEPTPAVPGGAALSAGAMLREAREKQGLHVAALAASIKITTRKLEALEHGRLDELPDAAFARALALTVCRALKIDPAPVLAQLPQLGGGGLSKVRGSLNEPFRERAGRADPVGSSLARHPLVWAAALLVGLAIALYLLPAAWWSAWWPQRSSDEPAALAPSAPDGVASAAPIAGTAGAADPAAAAAALPAAAAASVGAVAPATASAPVIEVVHSAPSAETGAADAPGGVAVLRATEASWVEVVDAGGQVLLQRVLQPGESVGLDGRLPFRLKIGNAAVTELRFRGQAVDLRPSTRDNVVRLELK